MGDHYQLEYSFEICHHVDATYHAYMAGLILIDPASYAILVDNFRRLQLQSTAPPQPRTYADPTTITAPHMKATQVCDKPWDSVTSADADVEQETPRERLDYNSN